MAASPSKRSINRQAKRLQQRPGWNPHEHSSSSYRQRIRQSIEDERVHGAFDAAATCEACAEARKVQNDSEALCEEHLRQAMGL